MVSGITSVKVQCNDGLEHTFVAPMLIDDYAERSQRDCVVTSGINPAFADWIKRKSAK